MVFGRNEFLKEEDAVIKADNLSFSYGGNGGFSLENISFSLRRGEIMLLCGKSGSGKSTLLRLLKPEISPAGKKTGNIYFNGEPYSSLSPELSVSGIGYVGQNPQASPVADDVYSEISFLLKNLGFSQSDVHRRTAEISAFFGIAPLSGRSISSLSGGELQLVNLAAVMSADPPLLLLDEPTAQLDPCARERFFLYVKKISDELGTAIIICEHDTEILYGLCDKVLFLENGEQSFFLGSAEAAAHFFKSCPNFLPCSVRVGTAFGLEDPHVLTSSGAMEFVRKNFPQTSENRPVRSDKETGEGFAEEAVKLSRVSFSYPEQSSAVIDDLSFTAYSGSIISICGANGSGKSTLLRIIAAVLKPYGGSVRIFSKRAGSYRNGSLYRGVLAMLPQNPEDLMISDTALKELSADADGVKRSMEEIEEAVKLTGFDKEMLEKYPLDLSKGSLQLLALAKLLLLRPKILLLDEPEKGLDRQYRVHLSDLLKSLSAKGMSVVLVTHDLEFAAYTADRISLMFSGKLTSPEPVREFLRKSEIYTTPAARIGRGVCCAVTADELTDALVSLRNGMDGEKKL